MYIPQEVMDNVLEYMNKYAKVKIFMGTDTKIFVYKYLAIKYPDRKNTVLCDKNILRLEYLKRTLLNFLEHKKSISVPCSSSFERFLVHGFCYLNGFKSDTIEKDHYNRNYNCPDCNHCTTIEEDYNVIDKFTSHHIHLVKCTNKSCNFKVAIDGSDYDRIKELKLNHPIAHDCTYTWQLRRKLKTSKAKWVKISI